MEPAFKACIHQSVESGNTTLPESDKQGLREAIHAATQPNNSGAAAVAVSAGTISDGITAGSQMNPQMLLAIMQRIGQTPSPVGPPVGSRLPHGPDPFMDALMRLREHGIILTPDGKVVQIMPSTGPTPPPVQSPAPPAGQYYRQQHQPHLKERELRTTEEPRREETSRSESSHGERTAREERREQREETPAERRTREVIERAVARFQERGGEPTTALERTAQSLSPDKPPPNNPTSHPAPPNIPAPAIDPERTPRPPEQILSAGIRDAINDSRNDTARLLQQILANDPTPSRPLTTSTPGAWSEVSPGAALNPSIRESRETVQERLSQLRDALQTTIERTSPQPFTTVDNAHHRSQTSLQPGDFTRVESPKYGIPPQTTVQGQDRASSDTPPFPTRSTVKPDGPSCGTSPGALRAAGEDRAEHNSLKHEKANSLLEALSKATQKILSLQTLRKIESKAETAAITAAAAIALGVMGSEIVIRELLALSDEILKGISGGKSRDEDEASRELEQAVRELEAACADRGIETIGQPTGLVADIPGTVRDDKTGVPLAGVAVDGGPLGITHTNANGEFIFRNVTIDQGFVIIAKNGTHSFFPCPAVGTVSATTYLTILATPRSTDKARHT